MLSAVAGTYATHNIDSTVQIGEPLFRISQDTTPPTVTVTMPSSIQAGNSFDIYIQASDATGLFGYSVTTDEFAWVTWMPLSGTSFSRTLNVNINDPGTYQVYVTFTDDALNERTVTRTITVYEEDPTYQPANGLSPLVLIIAIPFLALIVVAGVAISRKRNK